MDRLKNWLKKNKWFLLFFAVLITWTVLVPSSQSKPCPQSPNGNCTHADVINTVTFDLEIAGAVAIGIFILGVFLIVEGRKASKPVEIPPSWF